MCLEETWRTLDVKQDAGLYAGSTERKTRSVGFEYDGLEAQGKRGRGLVSTLAQAFSSNRFLVVVFLVCLFF